ncbi:MAG: hypothetical protein AB1512_18890 [Thermodesulfobacteriota bacterium]
MIEDEMGCKVRNLYEQLMKPGQLWIAQSDLLDTRSGALTYRHPR